MVHDELSPYLLLISIFYHKKIKRKLDSVAVVENPVEKLKKEGLGPGNCRGRKRKERPCKFPPYHIY